MGRIAAPYPLLRPLCSRSTAGPRLRHGRRPPWAQQLPGHQGRQHPRPMPCGATAATAAALLTSALRPRHSEHTCWPALRRATPARPGGCQAALAPKQHLQPLQCTKPQVKGLLGSGPHPVLTAALGPRSQALGVCQRPCRLPVQHARCLAMTMTQAAVMLSPWTWMRKGQRTMATAAGIRRPGHTALLRLVRAWVGATRMTNSRQQNVLARPLMAPRQTWARPWQGGPARQRQRRQQEDKGRGHQPATPSSPCWVALPWAGRRRLLRQPSLARAAARARRRRRRTRREGGRPAWCALQYLCPPASVQPWSSIPGLLLMLVLVLVDRPCWKPGRRVQLGGTATGKARCPADLARWRTESTGRAGSSCAGGMRLHQTAWWPRLQRRQPMAAGRTSPAAWAPHVARRCSHPSRWLQG